MRILLVDDDEQLMEVLASKLIEERYAVDIADTGEMGWEFILLFDFDLVVLDWMLPDMDGVKLCRQIRARGYTMPIMLLTARDRHSDKVLALDSGADDYVVKPFNFDELTARIRALLRRDITGSSPILQWRNLSLNPKTHEVYCQDQILPLTPKEYGLMELLMRHPQQVFSPGAIIDNLWGGEDPPGEEAVRTHIKGLRQKLKTAGLDKDTIKTVYGVGYRLKSDEERHHSKSPTLPKTEREKTQVIIQTWDKFKNLAFERLADLENLAERLVPPQVTPEIYAQAKSSAHKLAGSLGCFGFPQGSKIAKEIEWLLENNSLDTVNPPRVRELISTLHNELQLQPFEESLRNAWGQNLTLLIVDCGDQDDYRQRLLTEARKNGLQTFVASNLEQVRVITREELIDVVLHKTTFTEGEDTAFLEQLHQNISPLPMLAIAEAPQLLDRLDIILPGVSLTLQDPVEPRVAIDYLFEVLHNLGSTVKVLILDDDPQVLFSLAISLQPWGFALTTLNNLEHFWEILEDVEPDLLILDIEMPNIDGIELCQILRRDRRYQQLPILFLSVHQDEKTQHQAFAHGVDDYLSKPVTGSLLAHRILNRLRRRQVIPSVTETNHATRTQRIFEK